MSIFELSLKLSLNGIFLVILQVPNLLIQTLSSDKHQLNFDEALLTAEQYKPKYFNPIKLREFQIFKLNFVPNFSCQMINSLESKNLSVVRQGNVVS